MVKTCALNSITFHTSVFGNIAIKIKILSKPMYNYIDIFLIFRISIIINMTILCDMTVKYWFPLTTNAFTSILFPLRMETKENKFCRCQLFLRKIMTDSVLLINLSQYDVEWKCTYNHVCKSLLLMKWIEYSCMYKNIPLPQLKSYFFIPLNK